MTRDEFSTGFVRAMRFVLQKHEREIEARATYYSVSVPSVGSAKLALDHATMMTDAAAQQFADQMYDTLEAIQAKVAA